MTDSTPTHPIIELRKKAEEARKKREKWEDKEVLSCPECETKAPKDDIKSAVEAAEKHDEKQHDGTPTAKVNGLVPPKFSEEEKEEIKETLEKYQGLKET